MARVVVSKSKKIGKPAPVSRAPRVLAKGRPVVVDHIEVRQTRTRKGWQWSWRAVAKNGRKLGWSGEFYHHYDECIAALKAVTGAGYAKVIIEHRTPYGAGSAVTTIDQL